MYHQSLKMHISYFFSCQIVQVLFWPRQTFYFIFSQYYHLQVKMCCLLCNLWLITHKSGIKVKLRLSPVWIWFIPHKLWLLISVCTHVCMYLHILQIHSHELCMQPHSVKALQVMLSEVKHLDLAGACCLPLLWNTRFSYIKKKKKKKKKQWRWALPEAAMHGMNSKKPGWLDVFTQTKKNC